MRRIAALCLSSALVFGAAACGSEPEAVTADAPQTERNQYVCDQFEFWRDGSPPYGDDGDSDEDTLVEIANTVEASVDLRAMATTMAFSVQNEDADITAAEAVEALVDRCGL